MKTASKIIFSLAAFAVFGHAQSETGKTGPKADELRRLESITWDLKAHTLKWTVQTGREVKGEFQPASAQHYEISPDVATMRVADEKRGLEQDEAALLHRLLDTISIYCAQSVVWWDHGEGAPTTDDADRTSEAPAAKPVRPPSRRLAKPDAKPIVKPTEAKPRALPVGVADAVAPVGR